MSTIASVGPAIIPVSCYQHGQMCWRPELDAWTCAGFDGEGCDAVLTAESASRACEAGGLDGLVVNGARSITGTCSLCHCAGDKHVFIPGCVTVCGGCQDICRHKAPETQESAPATP